MAESWPVDERQTVEVPARVGGDRCPGMAGGIDPVKRRSGSLSGKFAASVGADWVLGLSRAIPKTVKPPDARGRERAPGPPLYGRTLVPPAVSDERRKPRALRLAGSPVAPRGIIPAASTPPDRC